MVETRNISLGGLLFHVELPAYTQLKDYLSDLKTSAARDGRAGGHPSEVEYRLAELFTAFMAGTSRAVVTWSTWRRPALSWARPVHSKRAGRPGGRSDTKSSQEPGDRRLFRDPDDRIIGGVAHGIAHRVGVDPVVVGLVFLFFISGPVRSPAVCLPWCIIPKATVVSDRVAMKGDPVTLMPSRDTVEDQLHKAKAEFDNPKSTRRFRRQLEPLSFQINCPGF